MREQTWVERLGLSVFAFLHVFRRFDNEAGSGHRGIAETRRIKKKGKANMLKPKKLSAGDTVALVSLSSGVAGEALFSHRVAIGIARLKNEFGLNVVIMPNAMKGEAYLDENPQERAEDLMQAFSNRNIKGVITMIGGDDTIRLLPFIDFEVLHDNPKIFMGYSDTTVNHFMLYRAGITSYYGPCVLAELAENGSMHEYTKQHIKRVLFETHGTLEILPSSQWTSAFLDWADEENNCISRAMTVDGKGFELLQGKGVVQGTLLGGCVDVFPMVVGTSLWPDTERWADVILFLETSEEYPAPSSLKYLLRGLMAQGIIDVISGIIVGKPKDEEYYEEYKQVFLQIVGKEGSITFFVGFRISRIGLSAGIEDFEEEIVVVWVAVPLPSQGLDFVVNAFDFTGRDIVCGVCDNALKVAI